MTSLNSRGNWPVDGSGSSTTLQKRRRGVTRGRWRKPEFERPQTSVMRYPALEAKRCIGPTVHAITRLPNDFRPADVVVDGLNVIRGS